MALPVSSYRSAPTRAVPAPIQPLTYEEIRRLYNACDRKSFFCYRTKAQIIVAWRTQLRCSEILDITLDDVDLDQGTIRVHRGKGGKARVVAFDARCGRHIRRWIRYRNNSRFNSGPYLFPTTTGRRMSPLNFGRILKTLKRKAGITKRVHPHGFRHTGAIEMLNDGLTLGDIQQQLGHSSIRTTQIYLAKLNPLLMIQKVRAREW